MLWRKLDKADARARAAAPRSHAHAHALSHHHIIPFGLCLFRARVRAHACMRGRQSPSRQVSRPCGLLPTRRGRSWRTDDVIANAPISGQSARPLQSHRMRRSAHMRDSVHCVASCRMITPTCLPACLRPREDGLSRRRARRLKPTGHIGRPPNAPPPPSAPKRLHDEAHRTPVPPEKSPLSCCVTRHGAGIGRVGGRGGGHHERFAPRRASPRPCFTLPFAARRSTHLRRAAGWDAQFASGARAGVRPTHRISKPSPDRAQTQAFISVVRWPR